MHDCDAEEQTNEQVCGIFRHAGFKDVGMLLMMHALACEVRMSPGANDHGAFSLEIVVHGTGEKLTIDFAAGVIVETLHKTDPDTIDRSLAH